MPEADWIEHVLDDLSDFAIENGLPQLMLKLEDAKEALREDCQMLGRERAAVGNPKTRH